jgi:hypothetical protein
MWSTFHHEASPSVLPRSMLMMVFLVSFGCSQRRGLVSGSDASIGVEGGAGSADAQPGVNDAVGDGGTQVDGSGVDVPQATKPDAASVVGDAKVGVVADGAIVLGDAAFSGDSLPPLAPPTVPSPPDGGGRGSMGGQPDLDGGCSSDRYWIFPSEAFATYCGRIGDACQWVCGTSRGCTVDSEPVNNLQLVYCPRDPRDGGIR